MTAAPDPARRAGRRERVTFAGTVAVQLAVLYWPRSVGAPVAIPYLDKGVHALVFGAVAFTGIRAGLRWWPLAAVLTIHAGLSEVVQGSLLVGRRADPWDAVADLGGTALGLLGALLHGRLGTRRGARDTLDRPVEVEETPPGGTLGA